MNKRIITKDDLLLEGNKLNELHEAYKKSSPELKKSKWREFYAASTEYRDLVHAAIASNPDALSGTL